MQQHRTSNSFLRCYCYFYHFCFGFSQKKYNFVENFMSTFVYEGESETIPSLKDVAMVSQKA